jgi:hypothetical protein
MGTIQKHVFFVWVFFFFLVGLEFELSFTLAKQVLYGLIHTSSPFCSAYFKDGGLSNCLPRLASNHDSPDLSLPGS